MSGLDSGSSCLRKVFGIVLLAFVILTVLIAWRQTTIVARPASSSAFSAVTAKQTLTNVLGDQSPHPVDSEAEGKVRDRIVKTMESYGYHVEVQDTLSCRRYKVNTCARVRNIVAVRQGAGSVKAVLVAAHYDSVPAGPGASDDGTGVAIVMEVARLFRQVEASRNSVVFLLTDGEEAGLLGAKAFVEHSPIASTVVAAVNVEARGTSGQSVLFETGDASGWLIDAYAESARRPLTNSLLATVYKLLPNDTDLTIFKEHGIQGLNFAFGQHLPYYHTPNDNLEHLDTGSLQQQGDNVYGLLLRVANADLDAGVVKGQQVYTDVLGFGILHWPASWASAIAVSLLILHGIAGWRLRRRLSFSVASVLAGVLAVPLVALLATLAVYLATFALVQIHGPSTPWHADTSANRVAIWGVALLAAVWGGASLLRKANPLGTSVGIGYLWSALALVLAIVAPGASFLCFLPALALVIAEWVLVSFGKRRPWVADIGLVATPLIALLVVAPSILLIEMMVGFNTSIGFMGMGFMVGLTASMLLPLALLARGGKVYRASGLVVGAACLCALVLGIQSPAFAASEPPPLNVMYVQDGEKAFLASADINSPTSIYDALGKDAAPQAILHYSPTKFLAVAVPGARLSAGKVVLLGETRSAQGRTVRVSFDLGEATAGVLLLVPRSAHMSVIDFGGEVLRYDDAGSTMGDFYALACRGSSCNGAQVSLTFPGGDPVEVTLVKAVAGLPESGKALSEARNRVAVPRNDGDQSLVITRQNL